MNNTDASLWHPWLRINRVLRVMLHDRVTTVSVTLVIVAALSACIPGTYQDPLDNYARGLRLFDRGQPQNAILFWKPLAEKGDCDAQYRYGTLFFLGTGVPQNFDLARPAKISTRPGSSRVLHLTVPLY